MLSQVASYWKLHRIPILVMIVTILFYTSFAYDLQRNDFVKLILLYGALFFFCFKLIQFEKWNFRFMLVAGIAFRLVFLIAEPNLSQDFFRFIWDGQLVSMGLSPYLQTPDSIMEAGKIQLEHAEALHTGMGSLSAGNYSSYPPLNQLFFALAVILGGKSLIGSIIALRSICILADLGILYFGRKLLKNLNKSPHLIFWYFLNPLIIIELTGNLHFEGVMLFFFTLALYELSKSRKVLSAMHYGLSILVKLVPLMLSPLFIRYFKLRSLFLYGIVVLGTIVLFLIPFSSDSFITNYSSTVGLWFSNFEFNAGIYSAVEHIAVQYGVKPWELIKIYGKVFPIVVGLFSIILGLLVKQGNTNRLLSAMLWVLTAYYFLAPTVHPWYLVFPVFISLFTEYRYPLYWSALVFLSYSAYGEDGVEEHLWIKFIEYFIVFGVMIYEIVRLEGQKLLIRKK